MNDKDRIIGGTLGVVVGDALGVPVEFMPRKVLDKTPVKGMKGYGTHNQPAGTWSDDSSLTLCLADSLLQKGGYDPEDIASKFRQWLTQGYWSARGKVFDVGFTTATAIRRTADGFPPTQAGLSTERDNGNGSLMRILPAALYFRSVEIKIMLDRICKISSITHGHPRSQLACCIYGLLVDELMNGMEKEAAYEQVCKGAFDAISGLNAGLDEEWEHFMIPFGGKLVSEPQKHIPSGGYVVDTLTAATWCFLKHDSFEETVLAAVNLGEDTDTTAAVAGGLAGVYYGVDAIPREWTKVLAKRKQVEQIASDFAEEILSRK
ncbi:MAG: ADP-ribosylglycohydrolase family protein [Syntrophomonas sp.]